MNIFKKISVYYEEIYKDKNYSKETNYIKSLLKKKPRTLLDLGCCTGRHLKYFNKSICTGVDISKEMLKIAKKNNPKINFINSDILQFMSKDKYDCVVSLFHVANYMENYRNLEKFFKIAYDNLNKKGEFIFDFWNEEAVKIEPPIKRIKTFKFRGKLIYRLSIPKYNKSFKKINIGFYFFFADQSKKKLANQILYENHIMLPINKDKAIKILKKVGFKDIKTFAWLKKTDITKKNWYGCIKAIKN